MTAADLLAQNALLAGSAGLLLLALLPGLVAVSGLAPLYRCGMPLVLLLAFSLSLLINHHAVLLLTAIGQFKLIALPLVAFGLAVVVRWLLRSGMSAATGAAVDTSASGGKRDSSWPLAVQLPAAAAAAGAIGWLITDLARQIPAVFEGWDAVVSWNRWAVDWAGGSFPRYTYGYPQLLPTAWASTYLWAGSPRIEFFARGMMGLFPLGVALIGVDLFRRLRWPAALFAIVLWCALVVKVYPDLRDSGYADIPVAFFITLAAYLVLLAHQRQLPSRLAWLLVACIAAAAVHTKQAGWLIVVWALAASWLSTRHDAADPADRWRFHALWIGLMLLWILPWHAWLWSQFQSGAEASNISYVTADIYGGETLSQRGWRALSVTLPSVFDSAGVPRPLLLLALAACLLSLRDRWGRRVLLGLALPCTVLWALAFSYDTRNLMPAMPFYCMAIGLGLQQLLPRSLPAPTAVAAVAQNLTVEPTPSRTSRWRSIATGLFIALVLVLVLWRVPALPASQLAAASETIRMKAGSPEVNQRLLEMAARGAFDGKVITTYQPMLSIGALRDHVYFDYARPSWSREAMQGLARGAPICELMPLLALQGQVRWLLLHRQVFPGTVDSSLQSGQLKLEFETAGLRLMRLACPPSG